MYSNRLRVLGLAKFYTLLTLHYLHYVHNVHNVGNVTSVMYKMTGSNPGQD